MWSRVGGSWSPRGWVGGTAVCSGCLSHLTLFFLLRVVVDGLRSRLRLWPGLWLGAEPNRGTRTGAYSCAYRHAYSAR